MNIVIPMAGKGSRFVKAGYNQPKMLIEAAGRPMLYWALDSLAPHFSLKDITFVCLEEHLRDDVLENTIRSYCPDSRIVALPRVTDGQTETVLEALSYMIPGEPLIIYNCDTYLKSSISQTIQSIKERAAGIIPVFRSDDPAYSYALADENGLVQRVKEKEVISSWATAGLYYFSSVRLFHQAAELAWSRIRPSSEERYIAPLYNELIHLGHQVYLDSAEVCMPLGTPEQLHAFEIWFRGGGESA